MARSAFSLCVGRIDLSHACVLDAEHTCAYLGGRGLFGLVYVTEGEAVYRFLTGERIHVRTHDILLLSPAAAYAIETCAPFHHYTVNFEASGDGAPWFSDGAVFCCLRGVGSASHERALRELTLCTHAESLADSYRAMGILYELLSMLSAPLEVEGESALRRRLAPARELLDGHFSERVTVRRLAYACDMSETHFRRLFTEAFGLTAMQYLHGVRMRRAEEYLRIGYYTVAEVAAMCGFDDVGYFIKCFRRHAGRTPKAFAMRP